MYRGVFAHHKALGMSTTFSSKSTACQTSSDMQTDPHTKNYPLTVKAVENLVTTFGAENLTLLHIQHKGFLFFAQFCLTLNFLGPLLVCK